MQKQERSSSTILMITWLKFWWELDKTVHAKGNKIPVRTNKSRGFALLIRLCTDQCFRWKSEDCDQAWTNKALTFLEILGFLLDTFGIHSKGVKPEGVSLKQAKQNITKIDNYVRGAVSTVKERYQLSEHLQ